MAERQAEREIVHGDGVAFLRERAPLPADHAIVTSLPDHSELPQLGVDGWRRWFVETVALACGAVADDAVAIFYQTDVKHDGRWIDKGHLVMCGADAAGSHALWHKIVCRVAPGTTTFGRPAYTHFICTSRARRLAPGASTPDVLPGLGDMSWSRAMGTAACDGRGRVRRVGRCTRDRRSVLRDGQRACRRARARARRDRRRAVPPPRRKSAQARPAVRLLVYNVNCRNPDRDAVLDAIAGVDANVVLLQEIALPWPAALDARFAASHPHRAVHLPSGHPAGSRCCRSCRSTTIA